MRQGRQPDQIHRPMMLDIVRLVLFGLLLGAGLLAPGWLLGRVLGLPGSLAGAFLGSSVLLMQQIVFLDAIGLPIDAPHLAAILAATCAILAVIGRLRRLSPVCGTPATAKPERWHWQQHHWLAIPAALGLMVFAIRASLDPLSGWDVHFRWDFLGREIIRTGSLGFYPSATAEDFLHYAWCDGIAPLISGLYVWSYLSLGRMADWATIPVVLGQGLLVFALTWQFAALRGGRSGAAAACALLATSAVLPWSLSMGQETGFTALAVLGMFYFAERHRHAPAGGYLVWAGIAAGSGALAREYGLVFPVLGLLALAWQRARWRDCLVFALTVAIVALPWYLRNWLKTGHPLYCHDLGPLFPTNPVYLEYNRSIDATYGIGNAPTVALALLGKKILWGGGVLLALGLAAGLRRWRENAPWLMAMIVIAGLWLWSVHLTAGGYNYSMRMLSPVLALGAVLGGSWLSSAASSRFGWLLALILALLAFEAGARSLYLPVDLNPTWWRGRLLAWRDFSENRDHWRRSRPWPAIAEAAEHRKVLVSDPLAHAFLVENGARAVAIFSPEVRFLFSAGSDFAGNFGRLRALGFRFILVTRDSDIQDAFLMRHEFFRELAAAQPPVMSATLFYLYDLYPPSAYAP